MRSIREYIRKTLFDSSSILPAYRHDAPQRVKEFAFVRAPVERLADVLSRGFVLPDKDHVYSLNSQWRVADCSRGVPFAHINGAWREFPPAVEAHALHGACDAFEIYINVAPSDSGMKSYVQLASFWRGNGGVGFDVSIMPDTCFEAFVFLEAARGAGGNFPAGYYEPESMPYMLALRDACHPSGPLAGAGTRGRMYAFDIMERVPETTPLASVHIRLPGRKRYTELAYLFEYEGKERLVFKVTASALVHVQLLVECFRRAGVLPQGFGLGWRDLACDNKSGKPLFMSDTNLVWRSPTNPEQWVGMCQLMDADRSDRKVLMPTTGESLHFSLCRGDIADGEDVFFLSFAVNGRTMSVDTVRCTMWDLL